jgi:quinol monooxygenase YgiN
MHKKVVLVAVDVTINEGELENFKKVASELIGLCDSDPGALKYEWFLSADQKHCRVLEEYVDGDALLAHSAAAGELIQKLWAFCKTDRFEIFGDPGPKIAEMAPQIGAQIFAHWSGLSR